MKITLTISDEKYKKLERVKKVLDVKISMKKLIEKIIDVFLEAIDC